MPPAPMYESFAAVTLLVLGLLVLLARASQAMFEERDEEGNDQNDDHGGEDAGIPVTGAARIERHPETGQTRAERREREILEDETGETEDADEHPWEDPDETRNPWNSDLKPPQDDEAAADEGAADEGAADEEAADAQRARERTADERPREQGELEFTTGTLLANVALSQGVFGAAIVGAAWLAKIPPAALGVELGDPWNVGLPAVGVGVAVGIVLYLGNEITAALVDAAGVDYSEGLRESLAPDALGGWLVLLGVVLPIIAGFEELLFRAALVGAFSAGFGLSPWVLAVLSTVAFAIGHGAQGPGGVAVTGLLGFALAAAFVLTESLLVVVVAHYLVNALEFVVHEGLGIEWT